MKLVQLLLLFSVTSIDALPGKDAVIVVNDHLQSRADGEGGFRVRAEGRLVVGENFIVYRAPHREISIAASDLLSGENPKLVDATSNAEQTAIALLVFTANDRGKNVQRATVASDGKIRSLSSDQFPEKMIISRLFSLSKTGRYLLADVGLYQDDGDGRFKVVYQPRILDFEEEKILPQAGIDDWSEFRKQ
jgi:hypothetical protein